MAKAELRRYLASLDAEELRKEIEKLYGQFPQIKRYYDMDLGGEAGREALLNDYKEQIRLAYFGQYRTIWTSAKASNIQQILKEFRKIAIFAQDEVELCLHRVEQALKASQCFGFQGYAFYDSATVSFRQALELMHKEQLNSLFEEKVGALIEAAERDFLHWGKELDALRKQVLSS